ncbi:hypothetical protein M2405_006170 [Rhodococcus erythropolis]|nr:hypothetical protein [Rhodococcus erythropolis]MCW2425147.1 hypothetical protein [Rhodococcus erythropolis]
MFRSSRRNCCPPDNPRDAALSAWLDESATALCAFNGGVRAVTSARFHIRTIMDNAGNTLNEMVSMFLMNFMIGRSGGGR